MFKQVGNEVSSLSQLFKNFGQNFGIFNKSLTNIFKAFKENIAGSNTYVQQQSVELAKLYSQQNRLNKAVNTGKITQEEYNAQMAANKAQISAITTQTQSLTIAEKASAVAAKALSIALKTAFNVSLSVIINLIITGITNLVNKAKELREEISETAQEAKEEIDSLNDLIESYEEFADKISYTTEEKEKLRDIQNELSGMYHTEVSDIDLVNGKYDEEIVKLRELKKEKLEAAELSLVAEREQAKEDSNYKNLKFESFLITSDWFDSEDDYNAITEAFTKELKDVYGGTFTTDIAWAAEWVGYDSELIFGTGDAESRLEQVQKVMEILKKYGYANLGLYSELNSLLTEYQGYVDAESEAVSNLADNLFQQYELENPYSEVGQDTYLAWKNGLLKEAKDDEDLKDELLSLAEKQFPDYSTYFDNLEEAYSKFGVSGNINNAADGARKTFINSLSDEDLDILVNKIENPFVNGLDGATAKIEAWKADHDNTIEADVDTKSLDELQEAYDDLFKSVSTFTKNQSTLTKAFEEQEKYGQLSADTIQSLVDAGYAQALAVDEETGAVTLNKEAYEKLNAQKKEELELDLQKQKNDIQQAYDAEIEKIKATAMQMGIYSKTNLEAYITEQLRHNTTMQDLEEELASVNALINALDAPSNDDSSSSSSSKPQQVLGFEEELAKRKHEIAMGIRKEDDEYYDWLISAARTAYAGLEDYEDDLWKYEEEYYSWKKEQEQDSFDQQIENRKKLADDALDDNDFDTARENINQNITDTQNRIISLKTSGKADVDDEIESLEESLEDLYDTITEINRSEIEFNIDNMNDRLDALEKYAEKIEETYTTSDGTELDSQGKWREIKSVYEEAYNAIQDQINAIVQAGVEGNEDLLKELEEQLEEYADKITDTFKSAVEEEQDYIKAQKEAYSDLYDERIDKIKEMQDAAEEAADAEIQTVQDKIDALKKENETKEEAINLEKARQALEKAKSQRTRAVIDSSGNISYEQDQDAIDEAQEEYDEALLEQQLNILEDQKDALEAAKDKASEAYDTIIENLEKEQENGEKQFDIFLQVLDEYLNPDKSTSNTDVWSELAKTNGATYSKGVWIDKDGNAIDLNALISAANPDDNKDDSTSDNTTSDTSITSDNTSVNTDNVTVNSDDTITDKSSIDNSNSTTSDSQTAQTKSTQSNTSDNDTTLKSVTLSDIERIFKLPEGSLANTDSQKFIDTFNSNFNPYKGLESILNNFYSKEYTSNINNNDNTTNITVGDVIINNPVGNSDDLANELYKNFGTAIGRQITTNKS